MEYSGAGLELQTAILDQGGQAEIRECPDDSTSSCGR